MMLVTTYRCELRKLVAQKRTYVGLVAAVVFPLAFVITLSIQSGGPTEEAFGDRIRDSAFALPLLLLTFATFFGAPLVTAIVAGDIVAAEDSAQTLKTIVTRSASRASIYFGKALAAFTYVAAVLLAMGVTASLASAAAWGFGSLRNLSGAALSAPEAAGLVFLGYCAYLLPLLVIAGFAFFLSTVTRNSAASLVGALLFSLAFQLLAALHALATVRPYLLPAQFEAWQTLFRSPFDLTPLVRAFCVSGLYIAAPLLAGWAYFRRRDIASG